MAHTIEHKSIEDAQRHEPKGISSATAGTVYVATGGGTDGGSWTNPEGTAIASTGEAGAIKYLREDGDGTSSWQAAVAEGTAIKSTGEAGAIKYLREDGDGTCSWQAAVGEGAALLSTGVADKSILVSDGANGVAWQAFPFQGVYDDNIGAATTITGSGSAMTRINTVVADAAVTATGVEFSSSVSDGALTYTGSLTRHFHIACTMSIDISAGSNITCQAQLQKFTSGPDTWAAVTGTNVQFNVAASGAAASTAIHGDVMLSTNDKIVLALENVDAATDLQLVTMYIFAMGMPGT